MKLDLNIFKFRENSRYFYINFRANVENNNFVFFVKISLILEITTNKKRKKKHNNI